MKLIIPGACGFVGTNFIDYLLKFDSNIALFDEIILIDLLQYKQPEITSKILSNKKFRFIKGSIYDIELTKKIVHKDDMVLHLAVEANTFDNPQSSKSNGFEEYLQLLANKQISKFIFFSSADIYGINNSSNLLESAFVKPTTVYSANKAAHEAYLHAYHSLFNLPIVIFRPVTIFGPKQYPGWLIPRIITRAIKNELIQITGKGLAKRDWIYVEDVCSIILKTILLDDKKILGETYNLGTGKEKTVIAITKHILKKLDKPESLIEFIPPRPGDVPRQITKAEKAKKTFDWTAQTEFYEGVEKTITYYKSIKNI